MLPRLYLHGLSSGDFELALRGLLGEGAPLSATSLQRLKGVWQAEYEQWKQGELSQLELVYWWADGLYVKAGIADRKAALLVIVGALSNGHKVLLACEAGERESKESWLSVLRPLKTRGLKFPKVTVADGHLGIWAALGEIHPAGDEQRCWNHKIINVLDALGKKDQATASEYLRAMMYAETRSACQKKRDEFVLRFKKTESKGVRNAHARLGTTGHLLRLSARALDASTHDQHRGVTVRPSAIANRCIATFQEDRERRGNDLEAAVRCREVVASTQCTTLDEGRVRGKTIQRRSRFANENAADEGSRLDLLLHTY